MSFSRVNGWQASARDRTVLREVGHKGARDRGKTGAHRDGRRDKKRSWRLLTCFDDIELADATEHLIQGEGNVWSFDEGVHSSGGARFAVGSPIRFFPTGGRFGGYMTVDSGSTASALLKFPSSDFTLMAWIDDGVGSTWEHFVLRSDGVDFIEGAAGAAGVGNIMTVDVPSQTVGFFGVDRTNSSATVKFDEIVVLPWYAPDAMVEAWAAYTLPFSPLPFIDLSGDIIEDPLYVRCRGGKLSGSFVQSGGRSVRAISGWRNNDVAVGATLVEKKVGDARQALTLPVSYWAHEPGELAASSLDLMPAANDGSITGDVGTIQGQVGQAVTFDGATGNRIQVTSNPTLEITGDLTIAMWVNLTTGSGSGRMFLTKHNNSFSDRDPYTFGLSSASKLLFSHANVGTTEVFVSADSVPLGEWVHVAVTRLGTAIRLYLNGREDSGGAQVAAITPVDAGDAFRIAQDKVPQTFDPMHGALDEIALWPAGLSAAQVSLLYNLGLHGLRHRSV